MYTSQWAPHRTYAAGSKYASPKADTTQERRRGGKELQLPRLMRARLLFVSRVAFLTFRDGDLSAEDDGYDGDEGKRGESQVEALHVE